MTDHRATDLSYGHPGQTTYDIEAKQWVFSIDPANEHNVRQISRFKECIPPSVQVIPENSQLPLDHKRLNVGNLLKAHPEFVPAKEIISQFVKTTEAERVEFREITGDVVVIGYAHARPRPIRIIALPCGEAGHILKLVKLRNEALAWEHRHGPSISPDSLETSEQGFWMSAGGVIRQIAVCDDGLEASPWLAVRQDSLVTIFRPAFDQVALAAKEVTARRFPLSRLNAHPVASLTRASHGSEKYVDMSFNPWYTRQFIAIDILGQWSIWSVGGKPHSSVTLPLVAGKSGNIKDAYEMNSLPGIPAPVRQDGWYRALWISNLSTIVIIGRREIVVFDIKARPKRLRSLQLRSERILDAKRSPADHSHLFVLTTSRVLWVKVAPSGHKESEDHGASIILSQRHFRDSSDASLKLCMLNRAPVFIAIYSGQAPLVNTYGFSSTPGLLEPRCWQSSFLFPTKTNSRGSRNQSISTLLLNPVALKNALSMPVHPAEGSAMFVQAWAVSTDLAMGFALCVVYRGSRQMLPSSWKRPPNVKVRKKPRAFLTNKHTQDSFSDLDGEDDDVCEVLIPSYAVRDRELVVQREKQSDLRRRIDWTYVFKQIFPTFNPPNMQGSDGNNEHEPTTTINELVAMLNEHINAGKDSDGIKLTTLYELFTQSTFTEDLDSANIALHEYLQSVQTSAKSHNEFALVTSNLTTLPSVNFPIAPNPQALFFDFLNIYDQLVDAWMAHLPSQVSVPSRLVKHKMIRQISIDLGLSSIGISFLRSNATSPADEDTGKPGELFHGRNERSTDNDSGFFSPEMTPLPSQRPSFSGRLITRTPSVYSQATDASSQTSEDPAIGRLRKYAVSIGSQPDPGRSKILSQWTVGADPSTYSWEAAKRAFMPPESGNEDSRKTRRENSRRRRLTEKFLSRQSSRATTAEPQPLAMRTDNQPAPHYDFSSQPESNMPMTQPDRGAFGSRTAQKSKKKRRNAGF